MFPIMAHAGIKLLFSECANNNRDSFKGWKVCQGVVYRLFDTSLALVLDLLVQIHLSHITQIYLVRIIYCCALLDDNRRLVRNVTIFKNVCLTANIVTLLTFGLRVHSQKCPTTKGFLVCTSSFDEPKNSVCPGGKFFFNV